MSFPAPSEQLIKNSRDQRSLRILQNEVTRALSQYESLEDVVVLANIEGNYTAFAKDFVIKDLEHKGWKIVKGSAEFQKSNYDRTESC